MKSIYRNHVESGELQDSIEREQYVRYVCADLIDIVGNMILSNSLAMTSRMDRKRHIKAQMLMIEHQKELP